MAGNGHTARCLWLDRLRPHCWRGPAGRMPATIMARRCTMGRPRRPNTRVRYRLPLRAHPWAPPRSRTRKRAWVPVARAAPEVSAL